MDQLRSAAPSAFAAEAHQGVSGRYAYIPTVNVIEGMIAAGFLPFAAQQSRTRIDQDVRLNRALWVLAERLAAAHA